MRSLRRQLTLGLLVAFVLLLSGGGGLVYWWVRDSLYEQFNSALRLKALIIVTDTQVSKGKVKVYFSNRFVREFDAEVGQEFFQVFDGEDQSVSRSGSLLPDHNLPSSLRGTLEKPVYWNLTLPNGEPGRAIGIQFQPRVAKNETAQNVTVVVASSRLHLSETVVDLRNILLGCGGALLALTAFVVPWVLRRGLRPLDAMAERATRIEADSLGQRFSVENTPLELQPIGGRLNDLLARLEVAFDRERRFGADLAHELRTPLAELRSLAELALKWPQERPPETDQTVLEIAIQMDALVARLLTLTRTEQGRFVLQKEAVAIEPLISAVIDPLASSIAAAQLVVDLELPAGASLKTDPVFFRSIVSNLIENAVAYAPPGSLIRVSFTRETAGFSLRVANPAGNLGPADLASMFERLWRKDAARNAPGHAGLGLALARSYAGLLGFDLQPTIDETGVLVMTLRGPLAEETRMQVSKAAPVH